jgi:hypothetical protein
MDIRQAGWLVAGGLIALALYIVVRLIHQMGWEAGFRHAAGLGEERRELERESLRASREFLLAEFDILRVQWQRMSQATHELGELVDQAKAKLEPTSAERARLEQVCQDLLMLSQTKAALDRVNAARERARWN